MHTGLACPECNFDSVPCRLPHSRKWCFIGHRRFLDSKHRLRLQRIRFDGKQEKRDPPVTLSVVDILWQLEDVNVEFRKNVDLE